MSSHRPCKQKQLPPNPSQQRNPPQHSSCKHMAKKQSLKQHSHLPISNNYTVQMPKHEQFVYESCTKSISQKAKSSPYVYLPSIARETNNQNVNYSNMSDRCYERQKVSRGDDSGSIYDRLRLGDQQQRPFQTEEESQMSNFYVEDGTDRNYPNGKSAQTNTRRKQSAHNQHASHQPYTSLTQQPRSQLKCIHKSPNFTKKSNHQQSQQSRFNNDPSPDRSPLHSIQKSQQLIKQHINQKIDRVCEKVHNLSLQKNHYSNTYKQVAEGYLEHGDSLKYHKSSRPDCDSWHSSIIHQNQVVLTPTSKSKMYHQPNLTRQEAHEIHQDNRIQHWISSPPKPSHSQFLQSRIIQMDKKITFANTKVLKLQQQLLQQRQTLIKKEKQWLLRQNQLLNWIDANQVEAFYLQEDKQSPKRDSLKKSHISTVSNLIVNHSNDSQFKSELDSYKQAFEGLKQLFSEVINALRLNDNWLTLMNRTLSHELPGTAFRVKEEMNLNRNFLQHLQQNCKHKFDSLSRLTQSSVIEPQSQNTPASHHPTPNNSQIYFLQSSCIPASEQFQIQPTKRNSSNLKRVQKSRKSLSCLSESKSATSTNKKHLTKSTHQNSLINNSKPSTKHNNQTHNHSLYHSRKSQYCDQVFYSRAREMPDVQMPNPQPRLTDTQITHSNQLYYMLSLQALAIQSLVPQQHSVQSTLEYEPEENLLSGMDAF